MGLIIEILIYVVIISAVAGGIAGIFPNLEKKIKNYFIKKKD